MAVSDFNYQNFLSNLQNLLDTGGLNSDAMEVINQRLARDTSTLTNAGTIVDGVKGLTDQVFHSGSTTVTGAKGLSKLLGDTSDLVEDLRTDISAVEGDLASMLGDNKAITGFHKMIYGGTSTESIGDLLSTASGKDINQILSTLENYADGSVKSFVTNALTKTLFSALQGGQLNFANLINTFLNSNFQDGGILQDVVDKLDTGGSLFEKVKTLTGGRMTDDEVKVVLNKISARNFTEAISLISAKSTLPIATIEQEVARMNSQLSDRISKSELGDELPPYENGDRREGYDDPSLSTSKFTLVGSYEELEGDLRNATRDITEIVIHWSESATNQYLTSVDLNNIQGGIKYHYVIQRNGSVQRGSPVNVATSHIPTRAVAQDTAQVQSEPGVNAIRTNSIASGAPISQSSISGHNKYSVAVCLIGGIAAPAGSPDYERFLSKKSITKEQWIALDNILRSFYKVFPGGQAFGHNSIQPDEPDPGFSVEDYVRKKFGKFNTSSQALTPDQANANYAANWHGMTGGPY